MDNVSEDMIEFLRVFGISKPFEIEPIRAGRNSNVCRLSNQDGQWILKKYYQHDGGKCDRLATEFNFLVFLKNANVNKVPTPLVLDMVLYCALYSLLPGNRPKVITHNHITQSTSFINEVNQLRFLPEASDIPAAADACFCWWDHIELTESRIELLMDMKPISELDVDVYAFVKEQLQPFWLQFKKQLLQKIEISQLKEPLPPEERILSPSDFGFHNILEDGGRLFFVDFEYAGWDDPAKLIADFICQPEMPVLKSQGQQFMDEVLVNFSRSSEIKYRIDCLLPVHRLKWCCILLNEFKEEYRERRLYAGLKSEGLLAEQFSKAKQYFNVHLAHLDHKE